MSMTAGTANVLSFMWYSLRDGDEVRVGGQDEQRSLIEILLELANEGKHIIVPQRATAHHFHDGLVVCDQAVTGACPVADCVGSNHGTTAGDSCELLDEHVDNLMGIGDRNAVVVRLEVRNVDRIFRHKRCCAP